MTALLDLYRPTRREVRAFYSSTEWRHARAVKVHTAGDACERCGSRRKIEVDHIVPVRVAWAGRLDQRNLQVLCQQCHRSAKRREEAAW